MNRFKKTGISIMIIILLSLFLGIGYAQITDVNLEIEGSASLPAQSGIVISDIRYSSCNDMTVDTLTINTYYQSMFTSHVELGTSQASFITLEVTFKNLTSEPVVFDGLVYDSAFYSNPNIVPSLSGITENQTILSPSGESGDEVTFYLTFAYDDPTNITNQVLNSTIGFHFTPTVTINYSGLTNAQGASTERIRRSSFTNSNPTTYNPTIDLGSYSGNFSIEDSNGTPLVQGTDYSISNGVITFLRDLEEAEYTVIATLPPQNILVTHITSLLNGLTADSNGIYTATPATGCTNTFAYDGTSDNNLRYIGTTPCNYVKFNCDNTGNNCETWRIIGVMHDTGGDYLKIIANNLSADKVPWNSSNNGDWNTADLNNTLNGTYLSSLNTTYGSNLIQPVNWNIGRGTSTTATIPTFYTDEHTTQTTNAFSIGLASPADLGYATSGGNTPRTTCVSGTFDAYTSNCVSNNWMNAATNNWTIMYNANNKIFYFTSAGKVTTGRTKQDNYNYRPCVYLKATVGFTSGDGSSGTPYALAGMSN